MEEFKIEGSIEYRYFPQRVVKRIAELRKKEKANTVIKLDSKFDRNDEIKLNMVMSNIEKLE